MLLFWNYLITFPEQCYNHWKLPGQFFIPNSKFSLLLPIAYKNGQMQEKPLSVLSNVLYILSFRSSSNYRYFLSEAFHFKSQFWTRMIDDSRGYRALTLDGWNPPFMEAELCSIFNWHQLSTQLNHVRVFRVLALTVHFYLCTSSQGTYTGYLAFFKSLSWVILKLQRNLSKRCHACVLHLEAMWIMEIEFI